MTSTDLAPTQENACVIIPNCAIATPEPISSNDLDISALRMPGNGEKPPASSGWGGPRANSGGARPNCGGPQPGSGRPRKLKPIAPVPDLTTPRWCVIAFYGQAEISATTELSRSGYETYLPLMADRRQDTVVRSMWHTIRVPLFSGYGFIRLTQSESREPILETRGVREVLRRPDGRAAHVPDALIDKLREDDPKRLELPKEHGPVLNIGVKVRLGDGAFQGYAGNVVVCDGVKTQVEIELFGRMVPIWVDRVSVSEA